jgi:hypothetical protein
MFNSDTTKGSVFQMMDEYMPTIIEGFPKEDIPSKYSRYLREPLRKGTAQSLEVPRGLWHF